MQFWPAVDILKQLSGELGLPVQTTVVNVDNVQGSQLLSLLNSAGNELVTYYPWAQFRKQWEFSLVANQESYDLPSDWAYFIDQTQWDRTNHWPLLGPKSAAEWAWLKGGIVAAFPRMRFRVMNGKMFFFPTPESDSEYNLAMEYVSGNWVLSGGTPRAMITQDGDIPQYDPWLLIKYTKLKFYELKGFEVANVKAEFMRVFESLTGKDTGAEVISLTPMKTPVFIGPWSIPDGSWNTGA